MFDLVTLLLLAGATARLTRLATADALTERARYAVWSRIAQPRIIRRQAALGEEVPPPTRWRQSLLTLVQCRWCLSFWVALATLGAAWAASHNPTTHTIGLVLAAALSLSYTTGWLADNEAPADDDQDDAYA